MLICWSLWASKLNNQIQLIHKITNVCDLLPVIPDQRKENYNKVKRVSDIKSLYISFHKMISPFHVHQRKGKSVDKLFGKIDFSGVFFRTQPNAGKDWEPEVKRATKNELVGWHQWINGHEFEHNCGREWRTGKPGVLLQSIGFQTVRHDLVTEQQ